MITSLDVIDGKEQREHAAQLEHFQISMNQLRAHVEWCDDILQRKKSVEILQAHHALIGQCRGVLNAEKLNIYKPSHVRYEINKENVENVRSAVPALGRVVVSNTDPLQSLAEGTGLQKGNVGSKATFKITTKDSDGNQCYDENDQIHVKVQSPSSNELGHMIALGNGEYSVTYTPDCVGQHDVLIDVNGQPLTACPWRVHVTPHRYKYLFLFGSCEEEREQLTRPMSIAIDGKSENVAVGDKNRVRIFSLEGRFLRDIVANKLNRSTSVAFSKSSELIVVASHTIFCFNENYNFVKYVTHKHLKSAYFLTFARDGRMVLCDWGDQTVKVLSSDGSQLLLTIIDPDCSIPCYAVCHQNMFFISYSGAGNVKVFSENGLFLYTIGTSESGDGQLSFPAGLAVDRFNNLVVCDPDKSRLQIYALEGKFVNTIEGQDTGLTAPRSVAVSSTGQLFVIDVNKQCVHVYQ